MSTGRAAPDWIRMGSGRTATRPAMPAAMNGRFHYAPLRFPDPHGRPAIMAPLRQSASFRRITPCSTAGRSSLMS